MSNEYKDWMVDRVNDLEYCLLKAIKTLKIYAETSTDQYEWSLSGKLAKEVIKDIDEYIDLSTLSDEFSKKDNEMEK